MEDERPVQSSLAFGLLLRRYRMAAGLTQEALAQRARMSVNGLGVLERGIRRTPQRETLALLAQALELSMEERRAFEDAATRPVIPRFGRSSVTPGPWVAVPSSNLPAQLSSFVGRATELDEIRDLIQQHRLVTVTGAGGIGKTRVALEVGSVLGVSAGAVWLIDLAPLGDGSLVASAITATLSIQCAANEAPLQALVAQLKDKHLLLLLDNCEHVIAEAALVAAALLRGCPRLRIMATSRESLRVAGERAYRLPSLDVPSPEAARVMGAAEASTYASIRLFVERAEAVDNRFSLSDDNARWAAEICRRLDGIPLAIELAASRIPTLPVKTLAEQLDRHFAILSSGDRAALPRQHTMCATIEWSYALLSEREKRVFERLSVFAGGCILAAAVTVCADENSADVETIELLSALLDKSLVVAAFDGSQPRYRLLESFKHFARDKLAALGETEVIARRHALVYVDMAEELRRAYDEPDSSAFWRASTERLKGEIDNVRVVLEWALSFRRDVALGQRLVGEQAAWSYYTIHEGRRWIDCALDLIDDSTPAAVIAHLKCSEGNLAANFDDAEWQLRSGQESLARFRELGDDVGIVRAQNLVAGALLDSGRMTEAESTLRDVLERARSLGSHRRLLGHTLRYNAAAAVQNGDFDAARRDLHEARTIFDSLGVQLEAGFVIQRDLAHLEFRAGNIESALRHAAEAKDALTALAPHIYFLGVQQSHAIVLRIMGACLIRLGRYDEAEARAREVLTILRGHDGAVNVAYALQHLAVLAALRADGTSKTGLEACRRAALVIGFVDARLAGLKSDQEYQAERDRAANVLCAAIDGDELATLMGSGATMTEEYAAVLMSPMQPLGAMPR